MKHCRTTSANTLGARFWVPYKSNDQPLEMRVTAVLLRKAKAGGVGNSISVKSLALSVYFKHPDYGMKSPEILSRASAFLLAVDPPDDVGGGTAAASADNPYGHLEQRDRERKIRLRKQEGIGTPVGGSADRELRDIGWLEYAPREARPNVHCVCSSHVVAPFLWKDYYPQDWLNKIKAEHW